MRLDGLQDELDNARDNGAAEEYGVIVKLGDTGYGIDRVEYDGAGTVRIYLEE